MYIGTTTVGRAAHFIVLEKGDDPKDIQELISKQEIKNLIISKEIQEDYFLGNADFASIFQQIEILHLKNLEIQESEQLYAFQNLKRLEIFDCIYKTKEPIDFLKFTHLDEVVIPYSKRFIHLFDHPKLKTIMLNDFNQLGYSFPENNVLETLSIEKSKKCDWNSLTNFKNLKSLYLTQIASLEDISWLSEFSSLHDIELSSCKKVKTVLKI